MSWCNVMGRVWWILYYWSVLLGGRSYSNNAEWKDLITDCFWLLDRWYRHRRGSILDILFVMIRSVMRYYWSALLGNLCAGWKIVYVSSSMVSSVWMFFVDFVRDFSIFVMILLIRSTCGIIRNGNIWFISALFRLLDRLVSFFFVVVCVWTFYMDFDGIIILGIYDNSGWKDSITLFTLLHQWPLYYHCWIDIILIWIYSYFVFRMNIIG